MSTFYISDNVSIFHHHSIGCTIGSFHIFFIFVFHEGIALGFFSFRVLDNLNVLDGTKGLHFSQ